MFVPMSLEDFQALASITDGVVRQKHHWNEVVIQGIAFTLTKKDGIYGVSAQKPEADKNASTFHANDAWEKLTTKINVSAEKSIETIAKDILRRFDFPAMVKVKEMFDADNDRYEEEKVKHSKLVDELEEACGRKAKRRETGVESEISLYTADAYYGDIKISYSSVEIQVRSMKSIELAKTIAALLKPPVK